LCIIYNFTAIRVKIHGTYIIFHENHFVIIIIIIIIIIIVIGKDTISFMHGIYTYIPKTNPVPKQYNVAAILSLLFMVPILSSLLLL
jgi:predicted RND superfamily exporter protein